MNLKVKYVILVKKKEVANTMTIVFKVSDNIKEMMIKHYSKMNPTKPQYTIFQVKKFLELKMKKQVKDGLILSMNLLHFVNIGKE